METSKLKHTPRECFPTAALGESTTFILPTKCLDDKNSQGTCVTPRCGDGGWEGGIFRHDLGHSCLP